MAKRPHKQIRLAQNFLRSPALVRRLIGIAGIGSNDVVYEIGPGKGIITAELARVAKSVVAVEKDVSLARRLRERFRGIDNIEIVHHDFLDFRLSPGDFKILANIPFNATADIMRKILHARHAPAEAFLIMQKQPARKFAGVPEETLFSLLAKPRFEFRILTNLRRTDFEPVPSVDSVLLRIRRRERLSMFACKEDEMLYRSFVDHGFRAWKRNLRSALKRVFTYTQWKRLSRDLGFPLNATPTQLSFEQWLGLYRGFRRLK